MKTLKTIYTVYALLLFWLYMLLLSPFIFFPLLLSAKGGKVTFYFLRLWARVWTASVGIRFEIYGSEHIDLHSPYIYIFNHSSYLDAPALPMAIPQQMRALGKQELSRIPFFGYMISRIVVWVDRQNPESRKASLERLRKTLADGTSIVVAPEGTRNPGDQLMPFLNGAFRLSTETGVPIMPMAILGAGRLMGKDSLLMSPGTIQVYFSKAIAPSGTDPHAQELLKERAFNRLEAMLYANA